MLTAKNNLVTALLHFNRSQNVYDLTSSLVPQLEDLLFCRADFKSFCRAEQFRFFGVQHLKPETVKLTKLLLSTYLNLVLGARGLEVKSQPSQTDLVEIIKKGYKLAKLLLDDTFISKFKHLLKALLSEGMNQERNLAATGLRRRKQKHAERAPRYFDTTIQVEKSHQSQHLGKDYRLNTIIATKFKKPESGLNSPKRAGPYESKDFRSDLVIPKVSQEFGGGKFKHSKFVIKNACNPEAKQTGSVRNLHRNSGLMASSNSLIVRCDKSCSRSREVSACSKARSTINSIERNILGAEDPLSKASERSLSNSEEREGNKSLKGIPLPFCPGPKQVASKGGAVYSQVLAPRKSLFSRAEQRGLTVFSSKQEIPQLQQVADARDFPSETSIIRLAGKPASLSRSTQKALSRDPSRAKLSKFYTNNKKPDFKNLEEAGNTLSEPPFKPADHQNVSLGVYEKLESSEEDVSINLEAEEKTSLERTVSKAHCGTEGTGSSPVNLPNRQSLNTAKKTSEIGFASIAALTGTSCDQPESQASLPKPTITGESQTPKLLSSPDLKPLKKNSFQISSTPISQSLQSRNKSTDKKKSLSIQTTANPYFLKVVNKTAIPAAPILEENQDSPSKATDGFEVQLAEDFSSKEEFTDPLEDPSGKPHEEPFVSLEGNNDNEAEKKKLCDLINDLISQNIILQNQLILATHQEHPNNSEPTAANLAADCESNTQHMAVGDQQQAAEKRGSVRPYLKNTLAVPGNQSFLSVPTAHSGNKKKDFEKVGSQRLPNFLNSKSITPKQISPEFDSQIHIKEFNSRSSSRMASFVQGGIEDSGRPSDDVLGVVVSLPIPTHSPVIGDRPEPSKARTTLKNALTVTRAANRIKSVRATKGDHSPRKSDSVKQKKLLKPNSLVLDKERMKENFKGDSVTVVRTHTIESFKNTVCSYIKATFSEESKEFSFELNAYVSETGGASRLALEDRNIKSMSIKKSVMNEKEFFEVVCSLEQAYVDTMPNTLLVNTNVEYLLRLLVVRYLCVTLDLEKNSLTPHISNRPAAILELEGLGYLSHSYTARVVHNHDSKFWLVISNSSSQR